MSESTHSAAALEGAQAMPAPTWHRLAVNDVEVSLPGKPQGEGSFELSFDGLAQEPAGFFEKRIASYQQELDAARPSRSDDRAVVRAALEQADAADLDVPALSSYQKRAVVEEVEQDVMRAFATGMGDAASNVLDSLAPETVVLHAERGVTGSAVVRIAGVDGFASASSLDLVAEEDSRVSFTIVLDSPEGGCGTAASELRVFAGPRAQVSVSTLQTLDDAMTALDDSGFVVADGAQVRVSHRVLGAGASYTGLAADLRGDGARIEVETRYIGNAEEKRDFNYVIKQRGRATESSLEANGVLAGRSEKVLRGTIDFVHGCKGSVGNEHETVVLADEGVQNKTVPVILCDEDDVMGNHGATIGHVRPEQRFYLAARGFSEAAIEGLLMAAALEDAYLAADEASRIGIGRVASRLGVDVEDAFDDEGVIA